jgi:hypothetical protein
MNRLPSLVLALLPLAACVYAPQPEPVPVPVRPVYDRSFDAALGALTDIGAAVTSADRAVGRITGNLNGLEVMAEVKRKPDGSVTAEFNASGAPETGPRLSDRWVEAYNRRMGR